VLRGAAEAGDGKELVEEGCATLGDLVIGHQANLEAAGAAGAVEVLVMALRAHPNSQGVQQSGCIALWCLTKKHRVNTAAAKRADAATVMEAAMARFPDDTDIRECASDVRRFVATGAQLSNMLCDVLRQPLLLPLCFGFCIGGINCVRGDDCWFVIGGMAILPTPVLGFLWMLLLCVFGEQQHGRDRLIVWVCAALSFAWALAILCKVIAVDSVHVEEIPLFAKIDTSHDGAFCPSSAQTHFIGRSSSF
jgi:hypothetical protein